MNKTFFSFSGTKGTGSVLPAGKHSVHIANVCLTNDTISNPFGDINTDVKVRAWDDVQDAIAVKLTNKLGGITERFHFFGFVKYSTLTEAQKSEMTKATKPQPRYVQDLESDYALEIMRDDDNKAILKDSDVAGVKVPCMTRVIDEAKSEIAQRILGDFLVACRVPKTDFESADQMVEAIGKNTLPIQITVLTEEYNGKTKTRMTNPIAIGTAVATEEAVAVALVEEAEEF